MLEADLTYLHGIALAALCIVDEEPWHKMSLPPNDFMVPSMGLLKDVSALPDMLKRPSAESARRVPLRSIVAEHSGLRMDLVIDDLDHNRDCFEMPLAGRLTPSQFYEWQTALKDAWRLLVDCDRESALDLASGLKVLTPLALAPGPNGFSATNSEAFGGCAISLPTTAAHFSVALVHEFQHSKLNAIMDLVTLFDPEYGKKYFAPWRMDPRPIGAMLHGTFAFLAVAELWNGLRSNPEYAEYADHQFANARVQLRRALDGIVDSAGLTEMGHRFVVRMAERLVRILECPIDPMVEQRAMNQLAVLEQAWLDTNR
jgi:uncharacterized protein